MKNHQTKEKPLLTKEQICCSTYAQRLSNLDKMVKSIRFKRLMIKNLGEVNIKERGGNPPLQKNILYDKI